VRRFFNIHTLDDVMFFRDFLKGNFSGGVYDFLLLGLISATSKCSYMYKDGAVIKVRKHPVPSFRKYYISLLNRMLWDLRKVQFRPCSISVAEGDARNLGVIGDGTIDAVITSPPYLNKIEYSRVYGIEELLFFSKPENSSIRSFIGLELDAPQMFPDMDLPPEANAYLADMKKVLEELYRVCSPGARLAFVIGTSWFGDKDDPQKSRHIECDVLLSRMAEELGFKTEAIYIVAERFFTIDRVIKIGKARESIVVLKK
jgi:SAM-dependent methyltransferase